MICSRWRDSFENFMSDVGPRPSEKHSIDRYPDNNGNYEPGNVRWATASEQARNTRRTVRVTIDGKTVALAEYTEKMKLDHDLVASRLSMGWTIEAAVTVPRNPHHNEYPEEWLTGEAFKK